VSLNCKEIDVILEELDLPGSQIQSAVQSAFDIIVLRLHKKGITRQLLISLNPKACRLHETFKAVPKPAKPLRFAQFLSSKIVNGRIEAARQLGQDRIVRLDVSYAGSLFFLYLRLWSGAANFVVTGEDGTVLDAMRRLPKRGEVTGGTFSLPETAPNGDGGKNVAGKEYLVRSLPGEGSFNSKIDAFYSEQGGTLSLEALKEAATRSFEGRIGRLNAAVEKLRGKAAEFANAEALKEAGDAILSNLSSIKAGDEWLETPEERRRIKLDSKLAPAAQAGLYYDQYRKAKKGYGEIQAQIAESERELAELKAALEALLAETNPLALAKLLKQEGKGASAASAADKKRPGLAFKKGDWLILVGRDASENDELLRRHVNGNDLWLHARDYHGSYVFIKRRAGKTVPLDVLLDAGNLAIFYSKGRNSGGGDLFYTHVKYLRRAKNAPKGLVIPTQEKNLSVKLDDKRLRALESCRVAK